MARSVPGGESTAGAADEVHAEVEEQADGTCFRGMVRRDAGGSAAGRGRGSSRKADAQPAGLCCTCLVRIIASPNSFWSS